MPVRKHAARAVDMYRARVKSMNASEVLMGVPKFDLAHEFQLAGYPSVMVTDFTIVYPLWHQLISTIGHDNFFFGRDDRIWFTNSEDAVMFALQAP